MKKILLLLSLCAFLSVNAQTPSEISNINAGAWNDLTATGSIAANATSAASVTLQGQGLATIQLSGTFVATVQVQLSADGGTTWTNITGSNQIKNKATGVYMGSGNLTAVGLYQIDVSAVNGIRAITTAYTSGTVNVTIRAGRAANIVFLEGTPAVTLSSGTVTTVTTLSQFVAAAALADAKANPTTTMVGAGGLNYNGATWDLNRNNQNTTTGDAGAKTTSFAGATQTNFNARGATITVLCGTVTGTTPTLNAQLQFSPDGGTTWINIGAASGNATATGNTITFMIYPANFSVAGATPAALTTGATATVQLNTVLPRTWRLNYTIGGTTPSFTITGVYVNYQL